MHPVPLPETASPAHTDLASLSRRMLADLTEALGRIDQVNRTTHILSMNARVEAARAGEVGRGFAVVAEELTRLAAEAKRAVQDLGERSRVTGTALEAEARRMSTDVVDERLCDLALHAMDLVDRNLYERSCDVRWWATDAAVVGCLAAPEAQAVRTASERLGRILDSYTVYADLVLADLDGRIVANGRPRQFTASVGSTVADTPWFRTALATRDGGEFGFQSVHASPLAGGERVLVYSCAVREGGQVQGRAIGVLGIVFRWDALGPETLARLPLAPPEREAMRAVIVDGQGRVLADVDRGRIGETLEFDGRDRLFAAPRGVLTARVDGMSMRICHARSPGFETYATGWHALLLRPAA